MSENDLIKFRNILTSNGYRITKAREATFNLLLNPEPQSIREILSRTKGEVDRVSVYRNIELFEKLGLVHRIYVGWKYKLELSDQFLSHHHHLSCLRCGKVIDIADEKHIKMFIKTISKKFGFEAMRHQFEIAGLCSQCQVKQN